MKTHTSKLGYGSTLLECFNHLDKGIDLTLGILAFNEGTEVEEVVIFATGPRATEVRKFLEEKYPRLLDPETGNPLYEGE